MISPTRRWTRVLALAAALAAVALAACSDPGDSKAKDTASDDDATADATSDATTGDAAADAKTHVRSDTLTVVMVDGKASPPLKLAVQACAGLHNRKAGGAVFVHFEASDQTWIDELKLKPTATVEATAFVQSCVQTFPACVRYQYKPQQEILPAILTAAAVLEAVPLDESLGVACQSPALDAVTVFKDLNTPLLATKHVFEQYAAQTTGLAMLNPGYNTQPTDPANPPFTGEMQPALVDYVFAHKLFVVFLVNGCIDGKPEKALLSSIVNAGHWPTPVGVYGYNNSWMVAGGYVYEAQTRCLESRNMGAIASETTNLSFFSTRGEAPTLAKPMAQNPLEDVTYDPTKTYVAFVVGDGDNIQYMMTTRRDWFQKRQAACAAPGAACPSLTWTVSSHLVTMAPDLLRWYYAQADATGHDYFALPPSGHLYAYPSSMAEAAQDAFVKATENDAKILDVAGTVHWDWTSTWHDAEDLFLPKYARADGAIRGIFPVNVPYLFPAFPWWPAERFYSILSGKDGSKIALFKPRSWRGVNDDSNPFFLSPKAMADELASYPKGTVSVIYMTSDGGLNLDNSFTAMAKLLPAHVQLVSTDTATKLALAAGQK